MKYYVRKAGLQRIILRRLHWFRPGDVIGFFYPGRSIIPFTYKACGLSKGGYYLHHPAHANVRPGRAFTFPRLRTCRQYSVEAVYAIGKYLSQVVFVITVVRQQLPNYSELTYFYLLFLCRCQSQNKIYEITDLLYFVKGKRPPGYGNSQIQYTWNFVYQIGSKTIKGSKRFNVLILYVHISLVHI